LKNCYIQISLLVNPVGFLWRFLKQIQHRRVSTSPKSSNQLCWQRFNLGILLKKKTFHWGTWPNRNLFAERSFLKLGTERMPTFGL